MLRTFAMIYLAMFVELSNKIDGENSIDIAGVFFPQLHEYSPGIVDAWGMRRRGFWWGADTTTLAAGNTIIWPLRGAGPALLDNLGVAVTVLISRRLIELLEMPFCVHGPVKKTDFLETYNRKFLKPEWSPMS